MATMEVRNLVVSDLILRPINDETYLDELDSLLFSSSHKLLDSLMGDDVITLNDFTKDRLPEVQSFSRKNSPRDVNFQSDWSRSPINDPQLTVDGTMDSIPFDNMSIISPATPLATTPVASPTDFEYSFSSQTPAYQANLSPDSSFSSDQRSTPGHDDLVLPLPHFGLEGHPNPVPQIQSYITLDSMTSPIANSTNLTPTFNQIDPTTIGRYYFAFNNQHNESVPPPPPYPQEKISSAQLQQVGWRHDRDCFVPASFIVKADSGRAILGQN